MAREGPSYNFDRFTVDTAERTLRCNGDVLAVPPKVFDTLAVLVENAGRVVEKEELLTRVWPDTFVEEGNLAQNIFTIRRILGDDRNGHRYIETVPRRGYRFVAEVRPAEGSAAARAVETAVVAPRVRQRWLVTAAALAFLALAAGALLWRSRPPALDFPNRGWVLIAKFENRTGEAIFDDTVEYALERELSNSRFVNLVPPERVQDVFRLMKKPSDTRLDAALAREVAVRDGNVHMVLAGRTEKLGGSYVLSASLVEPSSGAVLRSFSEQAAGQNAVLAAVNRLSHRVRESLGEEARQFRQNPSALEKATTPSLRALQLYSRGMALLNQRDCNAAAQLFEQALAEDPDFATAHIYLAHCYSNVGKDKEAARHYQEALRLADTTTDRERYFIVGSYHDRFTQDYEKAIQVYEVLVREYPDHYWGVNNLALTYSYLGRLEEAVPYFVRRAELRPHDLWSVYWAYYEVRRSGRAPAKAEALLRKAQMLSQSPDASPPDYWAAITLHGARRRMRLGDYQGALQEMERVRKDFPSYTAPRREALTKHLAIYFLYLGRMRAANEQYATLQDEAEKHGGLAWLAEERGDMRALRFHLRRQLALGADGSDPFTLLQLVRAGLLAEAAARLPDERIREYPPRFIRLARAHIAIGQGRIPEALDLLTKLHGSMTANRDVFACTAAIPLAEILERRGDLAGAANVLRQALEANQAPVIVTDFRKAKLQLARLYRKLGNEAEARALEAEIRQSLAVADADHPMRLALERNQQIRAAR